ncbi:Lrp/AsnC family transcriptional regulator [Hydrogenispora ethanolica]|uniref:Lrp/AsnC family transcriptional regulator n=1 Tax=Hydrogenispora ethanolica TaxID=1082276 RepID=UPI00311E4F93
MDLKILNIIQEDARISNVEIARRVGMAASATLERLRKLEESGIIRQYEARLQPQALGFGLLAFIFVRIEGPGAALATGERLAAIPEVQEVHHIAGEDCFLVKVRTESTAKLGEILREKFGGIAAIRSTRTAIAFTTLKETNHLPLPDGEAQR